jgi:PadR family transcriptional regulator PadR
MYLSTMHSTELIKGTLQTIILQLLSETDKMYGYEITQKVKDITSGKIQITEGALYPTLHKLEADGFVTTTKVLIGKRVRKYYTLTKAGNSTAQDKINEMTDFLRTMNTILNLKHSY